MTEEATALDVAKELGALAGKAAAHTAFWGGFSIFILWALVHVELAMKAGI